MKYKIIKSSCVECGSCQLECLKDAITQTESDGYNIDPALCSGCGDCVSICASSAIIPMKEK